MGAEPYLITSTLLASLGQRLVRTLCALCKRPRPATAEEIRDFSLSGDAIPQFWDAVGCPECAHLGYRGRSGVFEILRVTDEIRDLILQRRPASVIRSAAEQAGMVPMGRAGIALALSGATTVDELRRVVFADAG